MEVEKARRSPYIGISMSPLSKESVTEIIIHVRGIFNKQEVGVLRSIYTLAADTLEEDAARFESWEGEREPLPATE